jgi:Glycosyl hydrolases family 2, sugar binding domain/Glycosyl hydrolases family 2, TIM barrel domain/Glycosyl hydrolases family 2
VRARGRPTIDLDGEWRFVGDPERIYGPDSLPEGDSIQVPGCWEAQVARPYRIINAWYHRTVEIPADWTGSRVLICFGAVMYRCTVWLNGQRVGDHEGGWTPFHLDAREHVRFGESNRLAVEVVNPLNAFDEYPAFAVERVASAEELEPDLPLSQAPHGKQTWYSSMSGLWQSVRIERAADTYLTRLRVLPQPQAERVEVHWSVVRGDDGLGQKDRRAQVDGVGHELMRLAITDPDGSEVTRLDLELAPGQRDGQVELPIPQARLWDIGRPELYGIEATLVRGGSVVDTMGDRFGMRWIETRDGQIHLNGRPIYMLGALDQDFYPDTISTPPSREYLDTQFRLAQEMGLNLLRCHIKIPDPRYLDAADEAGILLWCELPNWTRFTTAAAKRGRATLEAAVQSMGNHPSVVIWTIINEDWGTSLRYEARDRRWLRGMVEWLRELDPSRLVVDNSACETLTTPNFHVLTDLADFHLYFAMPDNAVRWRNAVADFARRPPWLWSPHGDAAQRGDEPLVVSEFGNWGLPRLDRLLEHYGRGPWWFGTGLGIYRPSGIRRRFEQQALARIWPDVDALAEATQWHQYEALQYEISQMRRQASIQGYVITEFTDAYWEVNGLLDVARGRKAFHDRLPDLNAPDVVSAAPESRDLWGGDALTLEPFVSSYGRPPEQAGGAVSWRLVMDDGQERSGQVALSAWPAATSIPTDAVRIEVPDVAATTDARLLLAAVDGDGRERARDEVRMAVIPSSARNTAEAVPVAVHDPMDIFGVADRLAALGHDVVPLPDARLLVTTELGQDQLKFADAGGHVLALVRTRDAVPAELDLAHRVAVHLRRLPHAGYPGQRSPWDGDWVSNFNWILPEAFSRLPVRAPLDFAYTEVAPDHVLLGYDPAKHADEVPAAMFVGWVHAPAALIWSFQQGAGSMTLTTFRLAPERGPVATVLLDDLVHMAAARAADRGSLAQGAVR